MVSSGLRGCLAKFTQIIEPFFQGHTLRPFCMGRRRTGHGRAPPPWDGRTDERPKERAIERASGRKGRKPKRLFPSVRFQRRSNVNTTREWLARKSKDPSIHPSRKSFISFGFPIGGRKKSEKKGTWKTDHVVTDEFWCDTHRTTWANLSYNAEITPS